MKKPKVAILLSTYNGEKYIKEQVYSIYKQKFVGNIHLFIRDDGSKDNTVNILKKLSYSDGFITILEGENKGSVASFFTLMKYVKRNNLDYDYFGFADQDDVWDIDKVQIAIDMIMDKEKMRKRPYMYGSASRNVDADLHFISVDAINPYKLSFYNTIIQNGIAGHTQMFNKELFEIIMGNLEENKIYVHDAYVTNVASICGEIVYDAIPHVSYRQHCSNQLGASNKGWISWIKSRVERIYHHENELYAIQIEYITKKFWKYLNQPEREEMNRFLGKRNNFITRMSYIYKSKLYRQKQVENIAFKLLYLFGGYNLNN